MIAPMLDTPRLSLRAMTPADWPAYAAFMAGPRACFMGGPFDTRAAWGQFCHDAAGWALFGAGALMADRRADRTTVGQVGVNHGLAGVARRLGAVPDPDAARQPGPESADDLVFRHHPGARA